ncbi:MAG: hypothetical protein ACKOAH_26930, partial [Pirellula sp.]
MGHSEEKQQSTIASTRSVIVAAGLTRSPLKPLEQWPTWVDPDSRIGVQAIVDFDSIAEECGD